jgi:hypothetical protein
MRLRIDSIENCYGDDERTTYMPVRWDDYFTLKLASLFLNFPASHVEHNGYTTLATPFDLLSRS